MRYHLVVAAVICAFVAKSESAQGITFRYDHSVAVKDLAEEDGQGATLSSPKLIALPPFPPEALIAWAGGEAVVRFHVAQDGTISEVKLISASAGIFGQASLSAVAKWRFGNPVILKSGAATQLWARCRLVFLVG